MIGNTQTILVLGASGMLGNAVLRFFADVDGYMVKGTVRSTSAIQLFPKKFRNLLMLGFDFLPVNKIGLYCELGQYSACQKSPGLPVWRR